MCVCVCVCLLFSLCVCTCVEISDKIMEESEKETIILNFSESSSFSSTQGGLNPSFVRPNDLSERNFKLLLHSMAFREKASF